jgi:hypothetical protein
LGGEVVLQAARPAYGHVVTVRHRLVVGWYAGVDQEPIVTSNPRDSYSQLTVADLLVVARARSISLPDEADRDAIVAVLRNHDEQPSRHDEHPFQSPVRDSTTNAPPERSGWWTAMSVAELRTLARAHGLNVPPGMHRRELVALLVEHDVPKPPAQKSGGRRRSR